MPTMTIPSANMRRLKKLAAEAAAKSASASASGGGRPRANKTTLRGTSPPPPVPRREKRVVVAGGARFGARVLVRAPAAASSAGTGVVRATLVRAVVVSSAEDEDGYLEVVFEGAASPPGEDPFATVRVPRDQIVAATDTSPASSGGGAGREASSDPGAETENLRILVRAASSS